MATMPNPLRLIRNAAALAAASPTLLFSDWKNAARLKRNESDLLFWGGGDKVYWSNESYM